MMMVPPPIPPPPLPPPMNANEFKHHQQNHNQQQSSFNQKSNNGNGNVHRALTPEPSLITDAVLPQQETPIPKTKMKTINWNKIPPNKVVGKNNIWSIVANSHQNSPMADLDWAEMEGLFCQSQQNSGNNGGSGGSPKLGRDGGGGDTLDRKLTNKKENSEITLLDGKRSLNVNIFLKQFRTSNDDIIQLIMDGEHDDIGNEKLRGLLKILPEIDELDMLKTFDGDKNRLGNAEKFLLQLVQVPK